MMYDFETRVAVAELKGRIKHIDSKIKELETKNKIDEDELY